MLPKACSEQITRSVVIGASQAQTAASAASAAQVRTDAASNRIRCFEHGTAASEFAAEHLTPPQKMTAPRQPIWEGHPE